MKNFFKNPKYAFFIILILLFAVFVNTNTASAHWVSGSFSISYTVSNSNSQTTYKLTTNTAGTGSGTVSGGGTYNKGYVIPITANSSPDSKFVSWSGASCNVANTSSSSTTITMDTDKTCTANFTLVLVDGICAVNHYQCTSGAPIINNNSSGLDVWTWTCQGSSGGISHACTQNKPSFLEK